MDLLVANAKVTLVSYNVFIAIAVEFIASVEAVLAAMLTCSQSNIHSHSHYFNHPSLHSSIHRQSIDSSIHPSIHPSKIASSNIRDKEFRPSLFIMLRVPHLESETGWTGELWSKNNLLKYQNSEESIFLLLKKVFSKI